MAEAAMYAAVMLGLLLLSAKLGEELLTRWRLPGFLGAVLVGLLLGPGGLNVVDAKSREYLALFTMLGINFLLFIAGAEELKNIELAPRRWGRLLLLGALSFLAPTLATALLISAVGVPFEEAMLAGIALGAISVGPMAKALMDFGLIETEPGRIALAVGVIAEIAAVLTFNMALRGWGFHVALYSLLVILAFYVFGRYAFVRLLNLVETYVSAREAPLAILVSIILLTGYIAELTGFNAALIALGLGISSAAYLEERPDVMERVKALGFGFFEPLFFAGLGLYVGALTQSTLLLSACLALAVILMRIATVYLLSGSAEASFLTLSKGGVDGALLLTALTAGAISTAVYESSLLAIIWVVLSFALLVRGEPRMVRDAGMAVKVADLAKERLCVREDATVGETLEALVEKGALVVVDGQERPVGVLFAPDLATLNPEEFAMLPVSKVMRGYVPLVRPEEPATRLFEEPVSQYLVAAVVDKDGRLLATVSLKDLAYYARERFLGKRGRKAGA